MEKIFLLFCAFFWMGYGLLCLFSPETPAEFIGYQMASPDALIEVAAMYGGLEFGLGCMFFYFSAKKDRYRPGLLLVLFTIGALAVSRIGAYYVIGGEVTVYTWGGIFYEGVTALIALILLIRLGGKEGSLSIDYGDD